MLKWFKKILVQKMKHTQPKLLLIDGLDSHGTNSTLSSYKLLFLAKDEGFQILLLPTHTNILQPLDVGVFHPFKVNLSKLTDGLKLLAFLEMVIVKTKLIFRPS